jgi:protein TonB
MVRSGGIFGYCLLGSVLAHGLLAAAASAWFQTRFTPPRPVAITVGISTPALQGQTPKAPRETEPPQPLPSPEARPKVVALDERTEDGVPMAIPADLAEDPKPTIAPASIPAPRTPPLEKTPAKDTPQAKLKPNVEPAEKETPASASSRPSSGARPDRLPRVLSNPAPAYPVDLLTRGIEGTVLVRIHVTAQGAVASPTLAKSSGHPAMDESALRAILSWRFEPARLGDQPVPCVVNQPVEFFLTNR